MQRSISKLIGTAALVGASVLAAPLYAATDGSLGLTSTGTTDVTVIIGDVVQISGLDDLNLGLYAGVGNMTGSDTFCVYRNSTGLYDLGVSTARGFQVGDGTNNIPYTVDLTDGAFNSASGNAAFSFAGQGDSTAVDCAGATNTTVAVNFLEANLQAAPNSSYSDTITLVVAPR